MERSRSHESPASRSHLRLAGSSDLGSKAQTPPVLSDLRVSVLEAERAIRATGHAVVLDLATPPAALHDSLRDLIEAQLEGRNPSLLKRAGYMRVIFDVEDHSPETGLTVDQFGEELAVLMGGELLDRQFFIAHSQTKLTAL